MRIKKAYKFRLKTTLEIEHQLWEFAGHTRFVWNYFWHLNRRRLVNKHRIMRYNEMDFWSKILKSSNEYAFLKEAQAHIIQQKLRDLDKAYREGFDKKQPNKRLPVKKKKFKSSNSFRFPEPKQFAVDNKRINIPKVGWISFFKSREIKGTPKNITISYNSGHWYASIQVEQDIIVPVNNNTAVGIDLGIKSFAVTSTKHKDTVHKSINSFNTLKSKLAMEQRKLKNKKKFSNNWKKQKTKSQKLHTRVANMRNDYLNKLSTEISKNHGMIFVEDLKVSNMSKSAKGTIDKPGRNVKAKSGLNRSILDQGWSKFVNQLEYKSKWYGSDVVAVDPRYTSQRCSICGYTHKDNRKTQAEFVCLACNFSINADCNAARNILAAGLGRDGLWIEPQKRSEAETWKVA